MPKASESKARKRMVVEEVGATPKEQAPVEEIKEKVEELQTITEDIGQSVEKSSEVQEQIVEAAEKVEVNPVPMPTVKDSGFNDFDKRKGPSPLLVLIPGLLLLGALLGGIYFYETSLNKGSDVAETPIPTVEPVASTQPSASASAQVNLTKYSITILNGSGIPGTAADAKSILTKAGFKVGSTGNADNYDYTKTLIKAKSTVDAAYLAKLSDTLAKTYVMDKNQVLDDTSPDQVEVIIGSSKN